MYLHSNHSDFYAPIIEVYLGPCQTSVYDELFFENCQQKGPKYTSKSEEDAALVSKRISTAKYSLCNRMVC